MSYPQTPYPAQAAYAFDPRAPPGSSSPNAQYFYSPRYSVHTATPSPRGSKTHARRASHFEPPAAHTYSARIPPQHAGSTPSSRFYSPNQSTPLRNPEYVSGFGYAWGKPSSPPRAPPGTKRRKASYSYPYDGADLPSWSSDRQYYYRVYAGGDDYYDFYDAPPPPYENPPSYARARTDPRFYYDQVPQYTESPDREPAMPTPTPKANQARPRRASHAAHTSRPQQQPPPPKQKSTPASKPAARKATDEDARRAGIPAGFSTKNWDPTEEPITLLGSVFDANSLGKWIYDWTVFLLRRGDAHVGTSPATCGCC